MITVLQRVSKGDVTIFGKICGAIQNGLVIFLGVMKDDTEKDIVFLTKKISGFRIFNDEKEKMNLSQHFIHFFTCYFREPIIYTGKNGENCSGCNHIMKMSNYIVSVMKRNIRWCQAKGQPCESTNSKHRHPPKSK